MTELKKGTDHELNEHADVTHGDEVIASKIAASHLKEDSRYYTHLMKMEKAVSKHKSIKQAVKRMK